MNMHKLLWQLRNNRRRVMSGKGLDVHRITTFVDKRPTNRQKVENCGRNNFSNNAILQAFHLIELLCRLTIRKFSRGARTFSNMFILGAGIT
jgi:hypothetical protein